MSGLGLLLAVSGLVRWHRLLTTNTNVCLCLVSGVSVSGVSVSGVFGESVSGVSVFDVSGESFFLCLIH